MAKGSSSARNVVSDNDYIHVAWLKADAVVAEAIALDVDTAWRLLESALAERNLETSLTLKTVSDNVAGPTRLLFVLPGILPEANLPEAK